MAQMLPQQVACIAPEHQPAEFARCLVDNDWLPGVASCIDIDVHKRRVAIVCEYTLLNMREQLADTCCLVTCETQIPDDDCSKWLIRVAAGEQVEQWSKMVGRCARDNGQCRFIQLNTMAKNQASLPSNNCACLYMRRPELRTH